MSRASSPIVSCRGLCKSFAAKLVLRGVDIDVLRGETLVVLGGSGSGKSVLLKHMNGLMRPDRGQIRVDGEDIGDLDEVALGPIRRKVGMLFQMGALFDSMSVLDNVAYPMRETGVRDEAAIRERVAQLLGVVGLADTEALTPAELSGGMRKRAALARALALEPRVLLYDEPTTGLDPVVAQKINVLIRDLQSRFGLTGVVVTHDLHSAFFVADRIAFLHEGRIAFTGTPQDARQSPHPELREFLEAAA
ncbi:MAG TPA: ATP-binding cassette domain-containing protein [Candidatus Binatia bacterium]|nr:ATP-binding cassette domain-containing protein [Candidatus Binatia bacterium]